MRVGERVRVGERGSGQVILGGGMVEPARQTNRRTHPTRPPPRSGGPAPAAENTALNKMPKAAKETIPDGAIFQPQPKSAAGRPASKAEMEMIRKSYYERGSVGRDSMFDWLIP